MERRVPHGATWLVTAVAVLFISVFLLLPAVSVFIAAFSKGTGAYLETIQNPDTLSAIVLTLVTVLCCVPINTAFGILAAWAITKFEFRGKTWLHGLIDLPFSVSPVVAGLLFVFIFGAQGLFGGFLREHDIQILYATPSIVIATLFITVPFVARELITLMEAIGNDEELAAASLGARSFQIFRRITLPNIRWGILYGVIICTARAMGEFGAVSVVSGHIRGRTNTVPLHVEALYHEYNQAGAFAVASLLTVIGVIALAAKKVLEWRIAKEREVV